MVRYDIVLVLYNSAGWLLGCIEALAKAEYDTSLLNLILIDNASADNSVEIAQRLGEQYPVFGGYTVHKSPKNKGFGAACNLGAAKGEAPHLFFLNVDTAVEPDVFTQLDKGMERFPEAGGYECRQLPYETGHHINPATMETDWASGAALVVRRAAFEEVGGFDRHLFMYCEDVDLSWRLRAAGYTLRYLPFAGVTHYAYRQLESGGAAMKLGEYAGGFYGNLLLRYKYGSLRQIVAGHKMYLGALRRPLHFDGVRRVLLKNYLRHFIKLWPFLFWRFSSRSLFKASPARFEGGFSPDRGLYKLQKTAEAPLVSVVVRTCSRPNVLRQTLQSLRFQTYRNFEVVVAEDGLPASETMIQQEFADLPVRYFATGQPVGRSKAGNLGLSAAKGEYCNFLDDDDYFYPDHLELMVSEAVRHPDADIVTAASMAMEANVLSRQPYQLEVKEIYPIRHDRMDNFLMCQTCLVSIQSVMFKRSLFAQYGGLNEKLDGDEDWSMWLKYFSVAKRISDGRLDIPRATSVFVVPATAAEAQARQQHYRQYEDMMLDDDNIVFKVTPRQMRQYYEGMLGDLRHLQATGKLDAFLKNGRVPGRFDPD